MFIKKKRLEALEKEISDLKDKQQSMAKSLADVFVLLIEAQKENHDAVKALNARLDMLKANLPLLVGTRIKA